MAERVLVTGARAVAALDIARSLRAAGYAPHLADCVPARLARWSNSAGPVRRYASPVRRPAAFAADLRTLIADLDPIWIVPTCEEVFHLSALAAADGWSDRLLAPDPGALATLHAKDRFASLCERLALPVPETRAVTDAAGLAAAVVAMGDVAVKPAWSRFGNRTLISPSPPDVESVRPTPDQPWVVQRRIVGEEVSFYAVCHGGRVVAFAAYGSDWRLPGGAAYAFRPAPDPTASVLRRMADILAAEVGTGQFACDAIVDAVGRPWLIECNPRATSGVHLFGRGADFGEALVGRGAAEPLPGSRHVAPALWLYGPGEAHRTGRRTDWTRQRLEGSDALTLPGDRWPLAGALIDTLGFALRAMTQGQSLTAATTADIEWNGAPFDFEG